MSRSLVKRWLLVVAFGIALASFQNCVRFGGDLGRLADRTFFSHSSESGNGSTYDGKTFVARFIGGLCPDGSPWASRIVINDSGEAALMRKDCVEIDGGMKLDLASLALMPHDPNNFIYGSQIFNL